MFTPAFARPVLPRLPGRGCWWLFLRLRFKHSMPLLIPRPTRTKAIRCENTNAFATAICLSNYTVQLQCLQRDPGRRVTEKSQLFYTLIVGLTGTGDQTRSAWAACRRLTNCSTATARSSRSFSVARGEIHQLLSIILKLRILVLLPVSTLPYVVKVKNCGE
jgi:hypothetical protein